MVSVAVTWGASTTGQLERERPDRSSTRRRFFMASSKTSRSRRGTELPRADYHSIATRPRRSRDLGRGVRRHLSTSSSPWNERTELVARIHRRSASAAPRRQSSRRSSTDALGPSEGTKTKAAECTSTCWQAARTDVVYVTEPRSTAVINLIYEDGRLRARRDASDAGA